MIQIKKRKICFINSYGYALYNKYCKVPYGGTEVQLYILSKEIAKNKIFDIYSILGDYNNFNYKIINSYDPKLLVSLTLKRHIYSYFKYIIQLFNSLIKIKPNIVIQRSLRFDTLICSIYCRLFRKKFIYSVAHDKELKINGKKGIIPFIFRLGLIKPDLLILQNKDQIKSMDYIQIGKLSKYIKIESGYEIPPKRDQIKEFILWVGRDAEWKRGELFISLVKKFPNQKFIMVCRRINNRKYWDKLHSESTKLNNLKFIEYIPFKNISKLFEASLILVNTSTSEGFPNTFIQAFRQFTPIISLNVNPNNIFNEYNIGFCCDNNFQKMVENTKLLIEDSKLYEKISNNCFEYFKENHNIKNISEFWIEVLKEISE